jgi:hypothetical protein
VQRAYRKSSIGIVKANLNKGGHGLAAGPFLQQRGKKMQLSENRSGEEQAHECARANHGMPSAWTHMQKTLALLLGQIVVRIAEDETNRWWLYEARMRNGVSNKPQAAHVGGRL